MVTMVASAMVNTGKIDVILRKKNYLYQTDSKDIFVAS